MFSGGKIYKFLITVSPAERKRFFEYCKIYNKVHEEWLHEDGEFPEQLSFVTHSKLPNDEMAVVEGKRYEDHISKVGHVVVVRSRVMTPVLNDMPVAKNREYFQTKIQVRVKSQRHLDKLRKVVQNVDHVYMGRDLYENPKRDKFPREETLFTRHYQITYKDYEKQRLLPIEKILKDNHFETRRKTQLVIVDTLPELDAGWSNCAQEFNYNRIIVKDGVLYTKVNYL